MNRPHHHILLQKVWRISFFCFVAVFMVIGTGSLSSCSTNSKIERSDKLLGPGMSEELSGASQLQCDGDPSRLEIEVRRAVRDTGWALTHLETTDSPVELPPLPTHEKKVRHAQIVHATGRTVGDQTLTIIAWPVTEKSVAIAVKVGYFGDASQQKDFIETWCELLHGKPVKPRDADFTLPDP